MLNEYRSYYKKGQYVLKLKKYQYYEGQYYTVQYDCINNQKYYNIKLVRDGFDYYTYLLDVNTSVATDLPLINKYYYLNGSYYDIGVIYISLTESVPICCSQLKDRCIENIECFDEIDW